ncbi:MAG: purine-nucleoside phosphorylase [Clostridia bacterium]|nr:purine-nucleoside phosphorylase [Clostridia bacterium]
MRSEIGDFVPRVLMVLGSGLGYLAEEVENPVWIPYGEIPHFRQSTAPDHAGRFAIGMLAGVPVMVMQGRLHYYEGYTSQEVAYPVRVAKLLGVHSVVLTNAAGGVDLDYKVGDLMLMEDHIKFFDPDPLVGENLPEFGPRFCDMSFTYTPAYRAVAKEKAKELGIRLQEGVYFYCIGPQFETPAEIRAIRTLGANAVGMSTVHEAIAASHCGMKVLGVSLITNMAAGILQQKIDGAEVTAVANASKAQFSALLLACLPELKG